ncbi:uncharacterized protein K02A2.6-like, partial [Frankliniella occidentalis]|uniref:RNA-directed DNA polymerase n=1 Tax=Frankliniella occidentalis TaxID=133901 RepID=A0A9C6X7I8_FRAOC
EPRLPLSRRKALEACVEEMQKDGVVEVATGPTTWVSRPHLVPKKKSGWRMVVDMRNVNAALLRERYPIPTREEMLCKISGSKWFSSLDFKWCYLQFELKEDVRNLTTFVTHFGMFRFKRMAFGLSIAAEVCQRAMEDLKKEALRNIPAEVKEELRKVLEENNMCMEDCIIIFIDDWLVHAPTAWAHNRLLHAVIKTIQNGGMTLNFEKCIFGASSVDFVGCKISQNGYQPLEDSVSVVKNFRQPTSKSEVHSFCGLATYFSIYVPEFAKIIAPLRKLLKSGAHFVWGQEQEEAFQKVKELIITAPVLGFFKKNAPTYVFADASPVALGALIVQIQDGQPKVIRYAGYALSEVEQRYSQTEKEAYALVFACEKFQFYLLGTDFYLVTDHKPLIFMFKNGANTKTASLRVERWALRLQEYRFKIEYRAGKTNLADPLSRLLPLSQKPSTPKHVAKEEKLIARLVEDNVPRALTIDQVLEETEKDTEIQDILKCLRTGRWTQELKQYRSLEPLLMECQGLLLKGQKIVLPKTLWDQALKLAHEGHLGMTAMKRTLRLKVWWLGMDRFVEDFVSMCFGCQLVNKSFTPEPIVSTALPAYAWEYVAVDFFEFDHKYLLALTDYYSRYVRIEVTKDETALTAVNVLEKIFIELSRPRKLASDNGPCFASKLFQDFLEDWGIVHVHKIRLWPQCNGEIERNNSNFVKRLQIAKGLKKSWKSALYSFVYNYNVTPHSSTGVPPMQLLFTARPLLTKFPTLPEENKEDDAVEEKDREAKFTAKKYADLRRKAAPSTVQVGDTVLRKNEEKSSKTDPPRNPEPAIVVDRKGAEVTVQTPQGKTVQRNVSFFHPLKVCEEVPQDLGNDGLRGQSVQRNGAALEPGPGGPRSGETPRAGETPRQQGLAAGKSTERTTSSVERTATTTSSRGRRSVGGGDVNAKEGAEGGLQLADGPGTPKRPARERKKPCWMTDYV